MQKYVCGFARRHSNGDLLLIKKNKPDWQRGLLNGIGGSVEEGEWPIQAMAREFEEEAGIALNHWREFCVLAAHDNTWAVHFFVTEQDASRAQSTSEEEPLVWVPPAVLNYGNVAVDNLKWLVPMAFAVCPVTVTGLETRRV